MQDLSCKTSSLFVAVLGRGVSGVMLVILLCWLHFSGCWRTFMLKVYNASEIQTLGCALKWNWFVEVVFMSSNSRLSPIEKDFKNADSYFVTWCYTPEWYDSLNVVGDFCRVRIRLGCREIIVIFPSANTYKCSCKKSSLILVLLMSPQLGAVSNYHSLLPLASWETVLPVSDFLVNFPSKWFYFSNL